MAQEEAKKDELTPEQVAALNTQGRTADVDATIKEQQKTPEQKAAEEKEAADKAAADKAEADKKAAEDEAAKKLAADDAWKEEWLTTGNEHADAAIEIMKAAGVTPVEGNVVFEEAIRSGDLNKVKWDVLEARIGKAQAALVKTGITQYYNTEYQEQQETVNYAYKEVGGEQGWNKIVLWAQAAEKTDKAFAKDLAGYRKALDVGGFAGKAAIDALKAAYEAAPGNSSLGGKPLERGGSTPQNHDAQSQPLGRVGYFQELEKAGGDRAPKAVKDSLWARRQAGIAAGI
ncbi:head scaffolding protein [Rhizobium phage RHEph08]|uniref:Putative capsid assembly protein n=2 Tax=Cuernavacavirus TaxID=2731935 RepID=L7TKB5_9CAUD|nr:head scaffolding protein [Rhizobium phage RHEph08]YP_009793281.1 head scaffolding protein [Rhizobium phage RHEph09]AGC35968.1 putative capsid assembly protein [Rhizobium phage RHEph08]AGC36022.1 putative capsid assembly protein [Rhizobium phage RHEph09]